MNSSHITTIDQRLWYILDDKHTAIVNHKPIQTNAQFILYLYTNRASRLKRLASKAFGIDQLIVNLSKLPIKCELLQYNIKNSTYAGECFFYKNNFIGYAFIERNIFQDSTELTLLDQKLGIFKK